MSDEKHLAVRSTSPFKDSLASTIGAGVGLVLMVGVPAIVVGGVVVFVGFRVWRRLRSWQWWTDLISSKKIEVRTVDTSIGQSVQYALPSSLSLPKVRTKKRAKKRERSGRIV